MALASSLTQLEHEQLIRRLDEDHVAYLFKHALTQDTAYQSLLKYTRRAVHLRVAQAIEALYPDQLDEYAALLARHYAEVGDDAKTLEYSIHAGDVAARIYANTEALAHYTRALGVANHSPLPGERLAALYLKLGRVLELSGRSLEALAHYQELGEFARTRADPALELAALMARATLHATPTAVFDPALTQNLLDQALTRARELDDGAAEAKILWNLALYNGFNGQPEKTIAYGERSVALARALKLREQLAYSLSDLGTFGYAVSGQGEHARQSMLEARALWRELGNLPMLADNLNNSSLLEYITGDNAAALALQSESFALTTRIGNLWGQAVSRASYGAVNFELGRFDETLAAYEQVMQISAASSFAGIRTLLLAYLPLVYAELGLVEQGLAEAKRLAASDLPRIPLYWVAGQASFAYMYFLNGDLDSARALMEQIQPQGATEFSLTFLPFILAEAEMGMARGDYEGVVEAMDAILGALAARGIRRAAPDALYYRARALEALGRRDEARAVLENARVQAEATGSARVLWRIWHALAQIDVSAGQVERARGFAAQARDILRTIILHIPASFRESFSQRADVRAVLDESVST